MTLIRGSRSLSKRQPHGTCEEGASRRQAATDYGADWTWALVRGKLPPVEFGYVDNVAANQEAGEWGPDGTQTEVITSNRTPLESNEENFETLKGYSSALGSTQGHS